MKTLQIIKDEYAKSKGYANWKDLIISDVMEGDYDMSSHYEELLILVQQEQQRIIAENATCDHHPIHIEWHPVIDKESIINEKNIIR